MNKVKTSSENREKSAAADCTCVIHTGGSGVTTQHAQSLAGLESRQGKGSVYTGPMGQTTVKKLADIRVFCVILTIVVSFMSTLFWRTYTAVSKNLTFRWNSCFWWGQLQKPIAYNRSSGIQHYAESWLSDRDEKYGLLGKLCSLLPRKSCRSWPY